jgi:hypothetical protein
MKKQIKKQEPKKVKCLECGEKIDHLVNVQSGENTYEFKVGKDGDCHYEEIEFFTDDGTNSWNCPECDAELFHDEVDAEAFLKGKKVEVDADEE